MTYLSVLICIDLILCNNKYNRQFQFFISTTNDGASTKYIEPINVLHVNNKTLISVLAKM